MTAAHPAEAAPAVAREPAHDSRPWFVPVAFDVFLVAVFGILVPLALSMDGPPADRWLRILAAIATVLPLLWRTSAPVVVLAATTAVAMGATVLLEGFRTPNFEYLWVPMLIALGAVAARRPVWVSLLALVLTYAAVVTLILLGWPFMRDLAWTLMLPALLCTVAWVLGFSAHAIRSRVSRLEADRRLSQAAVRVEREEIATGVEVIIEAAVHRMTSEADAARRAIRSDADATVAALSKVETEGVQAMEELRRFVRRLDADTADVREADPLAPATSRGERLQRKLLSVTPTDITVTLVTIAATMVLTTVFGGGVTLAAPVFSLTLITLLWRHQFPILVFALISAAYAGVVLLFHGGVFVWDSWLPVVGLLVALAAVAGGTPVWLSLPLAVFTWAYVSLAALVYPAVVVENVSTYALLIAAVWVVGFFGGRRRRRVRQLERDRKAAARRVRRDHAQLAYSLHDLIGHSITIMVLQAAGARRILPHDAARAVAALDVIDAAGSQALHELDELVQLLRSAPESSTGRTSAPPAGLRQLDALVERTRSATRVVDVHVLGIPSSLPPDIDATAFGVVREALANAEKHAGDETQVVLELTWETDALRIRVTNTVDVLTSDTDSKLSGGYGLTSLRERVHQVGGELEWVPGNGDFTVAVRFPLEPPHGGPE